jgi:hypothetical protein
MCFSCDTSLEECRDCINSDTQDEYLYIAKQLQLTLVCAIGYLIIVKIVPNLQKIDGAYSKPIHLQTFEDERRTNCYQSLE